jgi:integrase
MRNGDEVQGLARRADGRWKISATGLTFVEPNEDLAVERFYKLTGKAKPSNLGTLQVHASAEAAVIDMIERTNAAGGSLQTNTAVLDQDGVKAVAVSDVTLTPQQWAWLREQLVKRREWVAEQVGVEQIAWLHNLKRPTPSPTLKELGELYAGKTGLSSNEAGRSKLFWKEFSKAVAVDTVRELTHEHVAQYEAKVQAGKYAPKSVLHRYRKVRTILAHAIKRGKGVEDCRRALDITAMLEVKDAQPLDPRPISVDDFWAIHKAAQKADDATFAAMLLLALNAAHYPGEAAAVKWAELDLKAGTLVTRRSKTGVSRVAILWPETIRALKALPRHGGFAYYTRIRSYTVFSALDSWRKYRTAADLKDEIVFSMIRDASFTIACRASTLDQARVLAGHRLPGASDNYIRRAPQFVADACAAIRREFLRNKGAGQKLARSA